MRRSIVIVVALLALSVLFVGSLSLLVSPSTTDIGTNEAEVSPRLTSVNDSESKFWRFLSPQERFQQRSPINVIVRGDTADILRTMTEESDGDWEAIETTAASGDAENGTILEEEAGHATGVEWGEAIGATRYAWIDPGPDERAYWTDETAQLQDGDYYGHRYHIRLYESPNPADQWIAMQGHTEHFDWFTLRHRVDGVEAAQSKIESDFMSHPQVDTERDVRRIYLDNAGPSDANGWATVVELTGMIVLPAGVGLIARKRVATTDTGADGRTDSERVSEYTPDAIDTHLTDVDRRRIAAAYDRLEAGHLILVFTILALFLGVRMGGLFLERRVDVLTPHMIAAVLYPIIAVGIPITTALIARTLERRLDAALVAAGSLALAIWLDYGLVGVDSLPIDVVLQRMLVIVALGLIAGGATKRAARDPRLNDMLLVGVVMWVVVLGGTLLGYL
ncbi:hypothetical protein [Natronorubrum thiooxidans]|uniref:Uncharacterized protein n=1 Tax=Natronorubrum thiooxidans TaxID=308853 RepID=A0A1N7G6L3_9EURY|nr:hypothetical protein [Natronorubrum thiooxidans]SIS08240.1 hypothetical protein SAMN05421752_11039 [Natronorubrum thiooxidans]